MSALPRVAPRRVFQAALLQGRALSARPVHAGVLVLVCVAFVTAVLFRPGPGGAFSLLLGVELGYLSALLAQVLRVPAPWRDAAVLPALPVTRLERGLGSLFTLLAVVVVPALALRLVLRGADDALDLLLTALSAAFVVAAGAGVGAHVTGRRAEDRAWRWIAFVGLVGVGIGAGRYGLAGAAITSAALFAALVWDDHRLRAPPVELPDHGPLGAPPRPADRALWPFARSGWPLSLAVGAGLGVLVVLLPGLYRLAQGADPTFASAIRLGLNELLPPAPPFALALPGLFTVLLAARPLVPPVSRSPWSGVEVLMRLPIRPRSVYVQSVGIAGLQALLLLAAANGAVALALGLNGSISGPADLWPVLLFAPVWLALALVAHVGTALAPLLGGGWIRAAPWVLYLGWSQVALASGMVAGPHAWAAAPTVIAASGIVVVVTLGIVAWGFSRAGGRYPSTR